MICCCLAWLQGRFKPAKLQLAPDEATSLEAEFGPLLAGMFSSLSQPVAMHVTNRESSCKAALYR